MRLGRRPAEAVHVRRPGGDYPEFDEDLSGDHRLVAARKQRGHCAHYIGVLRRLRCAEAQEDVRVEKDLHG